MLIRFVMTHLFKQNPDLVGLSGTIIIKHLTQYSFSLTLQQDSGIL